MAVAGGDGLEKLEDMIVRSAEATADHVRAAKAAIGTVIFGQDKVVEQAIITILSGGHALLLGVPGLAKTKLVDTLGTVLGLIHTFGAVSAPGLSAADRQRVLASGIAEAMYNTAFGLGIAVTCMVAHLILHQRSKNIQHDLDSTQERVFNLLTIQTRSGSY